MNSNGLPHEPVPTPTHNVPHKSLVLSLVKSCNLLQLVRRSTDFNRRLNHTKKLPTQSRSTSLRNQLTYSGSYNPRVRRRRVPSLRWEAPARVIHNPCRSPAFGPITLGAAQHVAVDACRVRYLYAAAQRSRRWLKCALVDPHTHRALNNESMPPKESGHKFTVEECRRSQSKKEQ